MYEIKFSVWLSFSYNAHVADDSVMTASFKKNQIAGLQILFVDGWKLGSLIAGSTVQVDAKIVKNMRRESRTVETSGCCTTIAVG